MAAEAKFKVGDRVRRVKDSFGLMQVGREGVVSQASSRSIMLDGDSHSYMSEKFELVPAWQPKVGDRVTANGNTRVNIERHWNENFRRSNGEIIGGALVVTSVADYPGSNVGLSNKAGRSYFFMPANTLKPAAPAALTIEAGKFYKTRDGRKVGPMVNQDDYLYFGGWHYGVDGHCGYEGGDTLKFAERDLVAEWVDEPTASNDNGPFSSLIGKTVTVQVKAPAQSKFKVGDRVKLTRSFNGSALVGATGTIGARGMFDRYVDIAWDKNPLTNGQFNGGYYPEYFDLVSSPAASPSAIVALIENGQPKPSAVPHVHATEADAAKEAARLAGKHKGQRFGVFVLTTISQDAAPTYRHEWQRLAAKGEKIAAIKELRSITGLGPKATKDAVEHWVANDEPYSRLAA